MADHVLDNPLADLCDSLVSETLELPFSVSDQKIFAFRPQTLPDHKMHILFGARSPLAGSAESKVPDLDSTTRENSKNSKKKESLWTRFFKWKNRKFVCPFPSSVIVDDGVKEDASSESSASLTPVEPFHYSESPDRETDPAPESTRGGFSEQPQSRECDDVEVVHIDDCDVGCLGCLSKSTPLVEENKPPLEKNAPTQNRPEESNNNAPPSRWKFWKRWNNDERIEAGFIRQILFLVGLALVVILLML